MASSSPVHISNTSQDSSSRTGLVSSVGSSRSYGTVRESPSSFLGQGMSSRYCIHHTVEEGDTLQGLAVKHNVTVQQIQRLNNLWNNDSLHIRPTLRIPVTHSNESSRSGSPITPTMSRPQRASIDLLTPAVDESKRQNQQTFNGIPLKEEEEVKSKKAPRKRQESETNEEGFKTIAGILSSADEQLKLSLQFAEKLKQRCAERALPEGAYNRSADMKNHTPNHRSTRSTSPFDTFSNSGSQLNPPRHSKRVEQASEKDSETREKLEEQIFEL